MYLIIGASGFIGRHLYEYCKENKIGVLGTFFSHSDQEELVKFDICKDTIEDICLKYLSGKFPEAVIICSANTSIDDCIKNQNESDSLNVIHTKRILGELHKKRIKTVFLSSEAVFAGNKGMYKEEDLPCPATVYGRQKLQIEQYIRQTMSDYLIFRISRAVGSAYGERDIFHEFYRKIKHHEEIVCLKDQSFCLTEVNDIARIIVRALQKDLRGLYHLSSSNYITRFRLAKIYSKTVFGEEYRKISEKDYEFLHFLDNRHILAGLNGSKLADLLGVNYMTLDEILHQYINTMPQDE